MSERVQVLFFSYLGQGTFAYFRLASSIRSYSWYDTRPRGQGLELWCWFGDFVDAEHELFYDFGHASIVLGGASSTLLFPIRMCIASRCASISN